VLPCKTGAKELGDASPKDRRTRQHANLVDDRSLPVARVFIHTTPNIQHPPSSIHSQLYRVSSPPVPSNLQITFWLILSCVYSERLLRVVKLNKF
jgi:hypothetical protein